MALGLPALAAPASTTQNPAANSSELWIGAGTDGRAGSGTVNDPIDVSTQAKFDAFFSSHNKETGVTVHLGPGTFVTKGGIMINRGWRIYGSGMNNTTIQLLAGSAFNARKTIVINTLASQDNVISDLTVDGNIQNDPGWHMGSGVPNVCIEAAEVCGLVHGLKLINCGSPNGGSNGQECFWINNQAGGTTGHAYDLIIENCVLIAPTFPSYDTFLCCGGSAKAGTDGTLSYDAQNAIIRNNCVVTATDTVTQANNGCFCVAFCNSGIIENNFSDGLTRGGFYSDTVGTARSIVFRNNTIKRTLTGFYMNEGNPTSRFDQLTIEGNEFDLVPTSGQHVPNLDAICIYHYKVFNLNILRNRIHYTPTLDPTVGGAGASNQGIVIYENAYDKAAPSSGASLITANGQIDDNCIDLPLGARLAWPNSLKWAGISYENNYDSWGDDIIGESHARVSFRATATNWYRLFSKNGDGTARFSLSTGASTDSGSATLSGGTKVVSDPAYNDDNIRLTSGAVGPGVPGYVYANSMTPGAGFTLTSTSPTDTRTVNWYTEAPQYHPYGQFLFSHGEKGAGTLTQLDSVNGSNATPCIDQVRTGNAGGPGKGTAVDVHVTSNCVVHADLWPTRDFQGFYYNDAGSIPGAIGPVTTLTLATGDSAAINSTGNITTTGTISAANLGVVYTSVEDIKTIATVGKTPPLLSFAIISGKLNAYELISGSSGDFLPNDYNASTNNVSWKRVL